ncbi:hypothetical protein J7337_007762 [Fusarium musae]|uniref:Uncharacterized protein n=1 Tax=Fusarium musae TaxID=1042133 RepID=A0A9P8DHH7_9HYPO|nr:hypothetical protein J7337_007762 [Fusarium musae]KAG9502050.1 hypothetical protein J7337_007762 [Fusarium musae]
MGFRTTSTEIEQDRALRNVGQHLLTGVSSWKALGMTDSYLVAVTTEAKASERSIRVYLDQLPRQLETRVNERRPIVLDYPTSQIEHIALRTKNEGYIIVRGSSTLSSMGSSMERLFTDMVFFRSGADEAKSEIIVVAQAQKIFHLKFTGTSTAASSVAYLPVARYRILKIATNGQVMVALGAHSDSSYFVLLEVKLLSPTVRPQLRKIAELKEVSTSCQPKLSVIGEWNEPIALITTATPDGQYRVYHKNLITLANHNT